MVALPSVKRFGLIGPLLATVVTDAHGTVLDRHSPDSRFPLFGIMR
jgi:hypothetical protein